MAPYNSNSILTMILNMTDWLRQMRNIDTQPQTGLFDVFWLSAAQGKCGIFSVFSGKRLGVYLLQSTQQHQTEIN